MEQGQHKAGMNGWLRQGKLVKNKEKEKSMSSESP